MRLIDADALAAHFMSRPPDYYHSSYIVGEITAAPTIEPEPVKPAETELVLDGGFPLTVADCGNCGYPLERPDEDTFTHGWTYCPRCGRAIDWEAKRESS